MRTVIVAAMVALGVLLAVGMAGAQGVSCRPPLVMSLGGGGCVSQQERDNEVRRDMYQRGVSRQQQPQQPGSVVDGLLNGVIGLGPALRRSRAAEIEEMQEELLREQLQQLRTPPPTYYCQRIYDQTICRGR